MALSIRFTRILIVSSLIVLSSFSLYAQFDVSWDRSYGGKGDETLVKILPLKNGDYILAGNSVSPVSGNKTSEPKGWMDFWVLRINAEGDVIWDRTYGGERKDELTTVIQTADGNIILGGSSSSNISGNKGEVSRGKLDYWIVKIDGNGEIIWDRTIGGLRDDYLKQVLEGSDGRLYLGGNSFSPTGADKTEPVKGGANSGGGDLWIVGTDENGTILWDKTFGSDEADRFLMMKIEDNMLRLCSLYDDTEEGVSEDSDIIFTPENFSAFGGYWICVLDQASGNILESDHFGVNAYGYQPEKLLVLNESGFTAIGMDFTGAPIYWDPATWEEIYPKALHQVEYPFTKDPSQGREFNTLPDDIVDISAMVNISGQQYEVKVSRSDLTDPQTDDLVVANLILGGDGREFQPLLSQVSSTSLLVGSTSNSGQDPEKNKYSASFGGNDFWIVQLKLEEETEPKNWTLALGDFKGATAFGEYIPLHISTGIPNGNVVAAYARSFDGALKSSDDEGIWLAAINPDGTLNWERTLKTDQPRRVVELLTYEDGYYVGSVFPGRFGAYPEKKFSSFFYLTKLDAEGNLLWEREYPVSTFGAVGAMALALEKDGVVITTSVDNLTKTKVVYLDSEGSQEWEYEYTTYYYEYSNYKLETVEGRGYLISDYFENSIEFVHLDDRGNEEWIVNGIDFAEGFLSQKEYFYVHDQFQGPDDPIWDLRLRKFNYDGEFIDQVRFPDFGAAGAVYDFKRPDDGFVIFEPIGGQYIEIGPDLQQLNVSSIYEDHRDDSPVLLDFVDASPMDRTNYVRVIYDVDNSNYYLSAIPYTTTAIIPSEISNEIVELTASEIKVYPNPAQNYLWITGSQLQTSRVEIRDVTGRIQEQDIQHNTDKILVDTSTLPPGMYLITVRQDEGTETLRFVKE